MVIRRREHWAKVKLKELCCRAKRLGVPFSLLESDLVLPAFCPIFGTPLKIGEGKQSNDSPSVDRIIGAAGYVKGNIVVISNRANGLKREATIDELQRIVGFYRKLI